jgi:hypothetical protein
MPAWRSDGAFHDGVAVVAILLVSASISALIYGYGAAVRDICIDAGLSQASSGFFAVLACAPILAALYSID